MEVDTLDTKDLWDDNEQIKMWRPIFIFILFFTC